MAKRQVIRVGDRVRIKTQRFIERVGYALVFTELMPEFQAHPRLFEAMEILGIKPADVSPRQPADPAIEAEFGPDPRRESRWAREFIVGCAKAAVRVRKWGGPERSLHYAAVDESTPAIGAVTRVTGKRTAMTGIYYPPSGGYVCGYYGDEYDYEPGGLSEARVHVILETGLGDIEQCDVELVREDEVAEESARLQFKPHRRS